MNYTKIIKEVFGKEISWEGKSFLKRETPL